MKNFTFLFILTFFSFFLFLSQSSVITLANNSNNKEDRRELKSELKEVKIEIKKFIDNLKLKTNINKKEFEMKGIASNVTTTSFELNGKTILIDISMTGKLMQRGVLKNGSFVKAEGKVIDEKLYAVHIKVRAQFPTVTPSASPSPTVTPTPTPSLTATPTPTPTTTSLLIENENEVEENRLLVQDIFELIRKFIKDLEKELVKI